MFGFGEMPATAIATDLDLLVNWIWVAVLLAITTLLPNTQEFVARRITDRVTIAVDHRETHAVAWAGPGLAIAGGLGLLTALLMNLSRPSESLYFNF